MADLTNEKAERQATVDDLNAGFGNRDTKEILDIALGLFPREISFANSLGAEDLVIQYLLLEKGDLVESFVLDTGRLPYETYDLLERWRTRYNLSIRILSPKPELLEPFVQENGPNAFYQSIALRKSCCSIRKVEPLQRALLGKKAWITGMRREQSQARSDLKTFELDANDRIKVNPLAHWTHERVWAFIHEQRIPYNALHDKGYPSIGCAPCTRAIEAGEDIRAGRWWWELNDQRECGLHVAAKGESHVGQTH